MKFELNATAVLAVVGVAIAGIIGWRGYKAGAGLVQSAGQLVTDGRQAVSQGLATVTQAWHNATSPPATGGDPVRAALYGDWGYAGIDPVTGESATDGAWFVDEEARQYEYHQQEMSRLLNRAPPVVGPNGAAFGIYPSP